MLALARVVLLLLPLLFHSYTGTALRFPAFYQLLYWTTLILVLLHILLLSLANPESLEALIPTPSSSISMDPDWKAELRRIWWMLTLSTISDVCHMVLFVHVRSTAPTLHQHWMLTQQQQQQNKQPSVYFTLRSRHSQNQRLPSQTSTNGSNGGGNGDGMYSPENYENEPILMHAMSGK